MHRFAGGCIFWPKELTSHPEKKKDNLVADPIPSYKCGVPTTGYLSLCILYGMLICRPWRITKELGFCYLQTRNRYKRKQVMKRDQFLKHHTLTVIKSSHSNFSTLHFLCSKYEKPKEQKRWLRCLEKYCSTHRNTCFASVKDYSKC